MNCSFNQWNCCVSFYSKSVIETDNYCTSSNRPGIVDEEGKERTIEEVEFLITASLFLMLLGTIHI